MFPPENHVDLRLAGLLCEAAPLPLAQLEDGIDAALPTTYHININISITMYKLSYTILYYIIIY